MRAHWQDTGYLCCKWSWLNKIFQMISYALGFWLIASSNRSGSKQMELLNCVRLITMICPSNLLNHWAIFVLSLPQFNTGCMAVFVINYQVSFHREEGGHWQSATFDRNQSSLPMVLHHHITKLVWIFFIITSKI